LSHESRRKAFEGGLGLVRLMLFLLENEEIDFMREMLRLNSLPKVMSLLLLCFSIGLMMFGIVTQEYWAGFGLVLVMTSTLLTVGLSGPALE
jgi:hypothetical protein